VVTAWGCDAKVSFADFRGFVGSRTKVVLFHIWNSFGSVGSVFFFPELLCSMLSVRYSKID